MWRNRLGAETPLLDDDQQQWLQPADLLRFNTSSTFARKLAEFEASTNVVSVAAQRLFAINETNSSEIQHAFDYTRDYTTVFPDEGSKVDWSTSPTRGGSFEQGSTGNTTTMHQES